MSLVEEIENVAGGERIESVLICAEVECEGGVDEILDGYFKLEKPRFVPLIDDDNAVLMFGANNVEEFVHMSDCFGCSMFVRECGVEYLAGDKSYLPKGTIVELDDILWLTRQNCAAIYKVKGE